MSEVRAFAMGGGGPAADDPKLEPGGDYPRGFERITLGGVQLLTRTEALSWSRQAVLAHGSLYRAAQDSAHQTLRGRGPVPVLAHPAGGGSPWVVRRYYRGGFMRPLGDRFLRAGRPRSFTEVENSARISKLGFATPRIVAAAVYPTGLLYRADLVTEFVPQARTLADILLGGNEHPGALPEGDTQREGLACVADLIVHLAKAGVHHPDLNVKNVLIARKGQQVHAVLLDLDRCRVAGPGGPASAVRLGRQLRRRLARSIRKLERSGPMSQDDGEQRLTNDEMIQLLAHPTSATTSLGRLL